MYIVRWAFIVWCVDLKCFCLGESCEKVSPFLSVESSVEFYEVCDVKDLGLDVMI